jgi:NAD-dependent SIR2 family protein deacetylase
MMNSNTILNTQVDQLKAAIKQANLIIIGAGSGLSSASGLRYDDFNFFNTLFPSYHERYGLQTINEALFFQFPTLEEQYAFWARLISVIRYNFPAGKPYKDLHKIVRGKSHFVLTTNTDGQFLKSGFIHDEICSPQGDLAYFQCSRPCNNIIYPNEKMIKAMLPNILPDEFILPTEHIPRCPQCGDCLVPNVRTGNNFVEKPWIKNYAKLSEIISVYKGKNILLLELGVGANTPGIIRYPFEQLALQRKNTTLFRINLNMNHLTLLSKAENAVQIQADIGTILSMLN